MGKIKLKRMSFLSGLGLPSSLTSVIGLAVGMYIFKCASSSMDPAMAQWTPQFLAYAGDLIALVASQLAAAYAGVKSIEAPVSFTTGNLLGLWELLSVILFLTWALGISVAGYIEGALLWERYEAMETVGQTITIVEGYKYLALGCVIGVGAWISGLALGDSAAKLLGFFDAYDSQTRNEASDGSTTDAAGTAIVYDLAFHFVTLLFSYTTISAIAIGAFAFGYTYLGQGDVTELAQ